MEQRKQDIESVIVFLIDHEGAIKDKADEMGVSSVRVSDGLADILHVLRGLEDDQDKAGRDE